jgi:ribosomal protein S18 acetylase RimI-like enzyme
MPSVEIADRVDDATVEAVARLIRQLSSSKSPAVPTFDELRAIVESPATMLILAREGTEIVGMLTLVVFRIPTGVRAWIEDVVVDGASRGKGIGEALTRRALDLAGERGARTVELTSRPARIAANRLYRKLGFQQRDTNVYRYSCVQPAGAAESP